MANTIKYNSSSTEGLSLKKGNWWIGTNDVPKGPTSSTGFWNGITPPSGGWTAYQNKAAEGPSIRVADTDAEFLTLMKQTTGQVFASVSDALVWVAGDSTQLVVNRDMEAIITNGLKLYLDAGFNASWPQAGASWYDLAANSYNGTLINDPVYESPNDWIYFSRDSLQYVTVGNIGDLNVWTVEAWFRLTTPLAGIVSSIVCNRYNGSVLNFSIGTNNAPSSYNLCVGFFNGAWRNTNGFVPVVGEWYQVVGTYSGSVLQQYVNGVASGGTLNVAATPTSGGGIRLMARWDDISSPPNFMDGDLAIVRIYNRALSALEVFSNYSAQKSRFGLS